jgi:hypothetical protein
METQMKMPKSHNPGNCDMGKMPKVTVQKPKFKKNGQSKKGVKKMPAWLG